MKIPIKYFSSILSNDNSNRIYLSNIYNVIIDKIFSVGYQQNKNNKETKKYFIIILSVKWHIIICQWIYWKSKAATLPFKNTMKTHLRV